MSNGVSVRAALNRAITMNDDQMPSTASAHKAPIHLRARLVIAPPCATVLHDSLVRFGRPDAFERGPRQELGDADAVPAAVFRFVQRVVGAMDERFHVDLSR